MPWVLSDILMCERCVNGTYRFNPRLVTSIIAYMEIPKWKPSEEEREVMEAVWMQVKGACEKLKEETNAQDEHIRKMLKEMADRYYS